MMPTTDTKCRCGPWSFISFPVLVVSVVFAAGGFASDARITANGLPVIHAGSELDFRPYSYTDENGRPTGYGVELLEAVAEKMGLDLRIVPGPWDQVWEGLVAGRIDVLPVVARTPGREPLVDFSLPHTETFDAFFVRDGQPALPNLAAAAGKEIVVLRSDAAHHELAERKFSGKVIPVGSIPEGLRLVAAGRHDAMLCSKLVGVLERDQADVKGVRAGPPIPDYKRVFSFAVRKGDAELLEKLNQGLRIVRASGEYGRIYQRWLAAEDPWRKWQPYFKATLVVLVVLAALAVTLQWLVRKRTRELAHANEMLKAEVAERREAQDSLAAERQRLFDVLETMPAMICLLTPDYHVAFANRAFKDRFGESDGRRCYEYCFDRAEPCEFCETYKVLENGKPHHWEIHGADGSVIDAYDFPFTDVDGSPMILEMDVDITEWRRAEKALKELNETLERRVAERTDMLRKGEARYRSMAENVPSVLMRYDKDLRVAYLSPKSEEITGIPVDRFIGRTNREVGMPGPLCDLWEEAVRDVFRTGRNRDMEFDFPAAEGTKTFYLKLAPERDPDGAVAHVLGVSTDITERKRAEREREVTVKFLQLANISTGIADMVKRATEFFREQSGCEAVGIRLHEDGDYPYFETRGFSKEFVQAENSLCSRDAAGNVLKDKWDNPVLACMCGNIICGRFDPLKPFFSEGGSFWSNSTTELLATTTEADRQARTRNRCNGEGYESVALIALKIGTERLGLIQLNDRRKGIFTPEIIALWERLAGYLSVALAKFRTEETLKDSLAEKEILLRELAHRTKNNMQVISSLMSLQAATIADKNLLGALSDTQDRIRAMALVHEKLHRSGNFTSLNIKEYAEDLLNAILGAHHADGGRIRTETDLEGLSVSIDFAIPLGLIVNELVSNSLKHAFPGREAGAIFLKLRHRGERAEMIYRDDGPGLPRDFDLSRTRSLGLKLVHNLAVRQLRGTMGIRHGSGTEFIFTFDVKTLAAGV
jgi:PAS domain S-box-containing protein